MHDMKTRRCEHASCTKKPVWGHRGQRPTLCTDHKDPQMLHRNDLFASAADASSKAEGSNEAEAAPAAEGANENALLPAAGNGHGHGHGTENGNKAAAEYPPPMIEELKKETMASAAEMQDAAVVMQLVEL